jgi:hypothetical protein
LTGNKFLFSGGARAAAPRVAGGAKHQGKSFIIKHYLKLKRRSDPSALARNGLARQLCPPVRLNENSENIFNLGKTKKHLSNRTSVC